METRSCESYTPALATFAECKVRPLEPVSTFTVPQSYQTFRTTGVVRKGELWTGDIVWAPIEPYERFLEVRASRWSERPDGLVVFAETNGGEAWCWDTGSPATFGEYAVARVEVFRYRLYAPSFPEFLYRNILQAFTEIENREQLGQIKDACAEAAVVANDRLREELASVVSQIESIDPNEELKTRALAWTDYENQVRRVFGEAYACH